MKHCGRRASASTQDPDPIGEEQPYHDVGLDRHHDDMAPVPNGGQGVPDPGGSMPGGLDEHVQPVRGEDLTLD